jgi:hypothetical protein
VDAKVIDPPELLETLEANEKKVQVTPTEKKMTRNMKRAYEQVHNLQKVRRRG